jgi:hypothetical protein
MIDQKGERRASFGLADVFGADYAGPHDPGYAFIQAAASPLGAGIDARERIPIRKGFQEKVSVRPGATPAARWIGPAGGAAAAGRTFALGSNDVPPGDLTDAPQALTNAIGRGRSVYFAADITGVYGKFGYPSLRRLLVNAVNWASRDGNPIVARAPLGVEVRAYRQGVRTVVQLLNYVTSQVRGSSAAGGPAAEDVIPFHDIRLEVKPDYWKARVIASEEVTTRDRTRGWRNSGLWTYGSLYYGSWHFISSRAFWPRRGFVPESLRLKVFDQAADPQELAARGRFFADAYLRYRYTAGLNELQSLGEAAQTRFRRTQETNYEFDPDTLEHLKALGYVE